MDGTLKIFHTTLAFGDPNPTGAAASNPRKKYVDWNEDISVSVKNPKSAPFTVDPGASLALFNGTRSNSADGTTQWTLSLSPLSADRYRFTATSGTAPALRTARSVSLNGVATTVAVNANQTATVSAPASTFSAAQVGDQVFVPGTSTGDTAGPFNALNEGLWTVLAVANDGSSMQLGRLPGAAFSAFGESVTPSSNAQFLVFSAAGVQPGDGVDVNAGFASTVLNNYVVVAVTPSWFEVISTAALPVSAVATPGASGIVFYTSAKRYIELFADQNCVLRLNGDTSDTNKVAPWQPADINQLGHFAKSGLCWSATVVNKSTAPLNIEFITAE
jgi:hypothetical protein